MSAARRLGLAAAFILAAIGAVAQGALLNEDYLVTPFTVEDGLPQNSIVGIAQTPDGYIWMATYSGLARFDGVQFTGFDGANTPGLTGNGIFTMYADRSGRLWVVSDEWKISVREAGRFRQCSGDLGLPTEPLTIYGESPDGRARIEREPATQSYFEFADGKFKPGKRLQQVDKNSMRRMTADGHGAVWLNDGTNWFRAQHEELTPFLPPAPGGTNRTRIVRPSRDGGFWLCSTRALYLWRDGVWAKQLLPPIPIGSCTDLVEDREGNVWIGTWIQGLWRVDRAGLFHNYPVTRGKLPEAVRSLLEDREGNLWVGTEGSGVMRVKKRVFRKIDAASGLSGEVIHSVARDSRDNVWILNQSGLDRLEPGVTNRIEHIADFELGRALLCDRKDRIWVGTYHGKLLLFENNARGSREVTNQLGHISTLFESSDGTILAGSTEGLWETDGTEVRRVPTPDWRSSLKALAEDGEHRLCAGLSEDGLWRRDGAIWTQLAPREFVDVRTIFADGDTLWVGTDEIGLARVKGGRAFHFPSATTGLPRQVTCVTRDERGCLWLGSGHGVYRVAESEIDKIVDGGPTFSTLVRYTKNDGLPTVECAAGHQPTVCRTRDGRIWFATVKGVAVVDPSSIQSNPLQPPVLIESAQATGPVSRDERASVKTYEDLGPSSRIVVPPGNQLVEVHYTALTYTAPEQARFRYRLEGFSDKWTDAGQRRVAYFQGLPHGSYRFHVIACNNDGVWNESGAVLGMTIRPWYWQTGWFKAALASVALLAVWLLYRKKLAQSAAVNRLRLRIARDLHDEIGANLGSIGLNTELLMSDPALAAGHRQDLREIGQVTTQTAQAVRDIVWFTNPDFDNTDGMIRRMRELATLMLAGRKWTFDYPESAVSRPLSLEFRRNIFFIFKEALHNIVKHSNATEALISVLPGNDGVELSITDNGGGFDPAKAAGGSGLRNLRRRAEELGGDIEIASRGGAGTEIRLRAPFRRGSRKPAWTKGPRHGESPN